ncbi:MAG: arsenite methyltransferase [Melioribacteraceae bacterium]|nr:arsenite methyltransferase [Melioribacteraceae bacterium]
MNITDQKIREEVKDRYAKIAIDNSSCCSDSNTCCNPAQSAKDKISSELGYSEEELCCVPENSNLGLGCGNPQAIANLKVGETVLDLGSGAGFDAFLASKAVGDSGFVIGVDMTDEMLDKAKTNALKANITNVEFRKGLIEDLPVDDNSVDVIMSNCVINLSPEKEKVFAESFRVLKSGGRLAISDVVASDDIPQKYKEDMRFYSGCISGAEKIGNIEKMLTDVGFEKIKITPKEESKNFISDWFEDKEASVFVVSATIEAIKP